jgi:long-chain acyl-CoA synthetase
VAVVGQPHPVLGEEVTAAVVLRPGSPPIDSATLAAHCAEHLAGYEVSARWRIGHDALPVSATGKVAKRELVTGRSDSPQS